VIASKDKEFPEVNKVELHSVKCRCKGSGIFEGKHCYQPDTKLAKEVKYELWKKRGEPGTLEAFLNWKPTPPKFQQGRML